MANSKDLIIKAPSKEVMAFSEKVAGVIGFNPIADVYAVGNRVNAVSQWLQLPEVSDILEKLEGSPAGFITDKKEGEPKYSPAIRAQAIQDCLGQGARVVHNEINIIRGRGMLVKNFYRRMLDILGHEKSPSESCNYQMKYWKSKERVSKREQGMITFDVFVDGKWYNKAKNEDAVFEWKTDITVKFGGQYDTVDKAQGQVQRRAWKEFYETHSKIYTEDVDLQHDPNAVEPAPGLVPTGKAQIENELDKKADDGEFKEPEAKTEKKKTAHVETKMDPDPGTKAAPAEKKEETPTTKAEPVVEITGPEEAPSQTDLLGPEEDDLF